MDDFTEFVVGRRARLVRTAVLLGCPESDAEDVVQTTLARCLKAWKRVERADNRDAYVHRVLVNVLRDSRSRRWNGELASAALPERPERDLDHAEGLVVRRALADLRPAHREALVLRFFADLSEAQSAEALGVPPGTVKSRTARALAALSAHDDIAALAGDRRPSC